MPGARCTVNRRCGYDVLVLDNDGRNPLDHQHILR